MLKDAKCPFCVLPLQLVGQDIARCASGHSFDAEGLSLATNMAAARALWLAVRAMEDDAAGLEWRAGRADTDDATRKDLLGDAEGARSAAASLRMLASAAQRRLDGLAYPTTVVRLDAPDPAVDSADRSSP
jgi:hypothetical protein